METKDILKSLRKSKGFSTMQDFCAAADISFSTYQNYETGKRIPTAEILIKLADFYGVTTDYLLGRSTDTPPLSQLASQFNMSALEREIVDGYLSLPEDMRGGLMDFLEKAVAKVQAESNAEAEKAPTAPVEQSEPEVIEVAVAARSFGKNDKPPEKLKLKKRPGAGSILDLPDYKAD